MLLWLLAETSTTLNGANIKVDKYRPMEKCGVSLFSLPSNAKTHATTNSFGIFRAAINVPSSLGIHTVKATLQAIVNMNYHLQQEQ